MNSTEKRRHCSFYTHSRTFDGQTFADEPFLRLLYDLPIYNPNRTRKTYYTIRFAFELPEKQAIFKP